jgi:hypothetical protein
MRNLIRSSASAIIFATALSSALAIATALPASASTITYVFAPGASATFVGGNTETFAGSFTADTTNNSLISNITVTGPGPEGQIYSALDTALQAEVELLGSTGDLLKIHFAPDFGTNTITTFELDFFTSNFGPEFKAFDSITLTAAVPEVSTWAMMILGFCGLGFIARRQRNRQMAAA